METPWMTDEEACDYLRLKARWRVKILQRWVLRGKLRAGKVGKLYRYRKEDLDDFLKNPKKARSMALV